MTRIEVPWGKYGTIAYLAGRVNMFGKTALQKLVYFLQEWKKVPLGYDFQFYTYGPFSSDLMGDLDYTDSLGAVRVEYVLSGGYSISPGDRNQEVQGRAESFLKSHKAGIDEVVDVFGKSTAKRLELLATIHYAHAFYESHGFPCTDNELAETVQGLKPGKFSDESIANAVGFLREKGVIA